MGEVGSITSATLVVTCISFGCLDHDGRDQEMSGSNIMFNVLQSAQYFDSELDSFNMSSLLHYMEVYSSLLNSVFIHYCMKT